jgi:hypothetical protein
MNYVENLEILLLSIDIYNLKHLKCLNISYNRLHNKDYPELCSLNIMNRTCICCLNKTQ